MRIILSILVLAVHLNALGQQRDRIDSLKQRLLMKSLQDSTAVDMLILLAEAYSPFNFDSAQLYAKQAVQLASKIKDKTRVARSVGSIGAAYDYKGQLDSALWWYNKSLTLFAAMGDSSRMSNVYINIGVCYHFGTLYDSALAYYLRAASIKEKIGSESKLEYAFNNIGMIFRIQENYKKAIEYYQKSLALKRKINDQRGISVTLGNMATSYLNMGKYDSAVKLTQEGLKLAQALGDSSLIARGQLSMSQNYFRQEKFEDAMIYLLEINKRYRDYLEYQDLATYQYILSTTYLQQKQYRLAEQNFLIAEAMTQELGMTESLAKTYLQLSALYEGQLRYPKALNYHKKYDSLSSLMFNKEKTSIVEGLEKKYESERKEKEISELEIAQQKSTNQRNVLLLLASIVIISSILLYMLLRSKSKSNKIITKSLGEKETLLKEIHHRVKNNLQIISSLLSLQSRFIKDDQAVKAVTESKNRVKSMALIHQKLYQKDNLIGIDMIDYIENLSDSLFTSYGIEKNERNWCLQCDSLKLDIDSTIPLGLIINELVSNSLKHAFNGKDQTKLTVTLKQQNDNLLLKVQDTGKGFNHEKVSKDSFGLNLIDSLAQKLKASIEVEGANGACFNLTIKEYKLIS